MQHHNDLDRLDDLDCRDIVGQDMIVRLTANAQTCLALASLCSEPSVRAQIEAIAAHYVNLADRHRQLSPPSL